MKGLAGGCRGVVQSRSGVLRKLKGRTLAGGPPGMRWAGRTRTRWMGRKLDGTGATWLMSWNATGSAWISLKRDTNLTCHCSARTCAFFFFLEPFGRWCGISDQNVVTKKIFFRKIDKYGDTFIKNQFAFDEYMKGGGKQHHPNGGGTAALAKGRMQHPPQ